MILPHLLCAKMDFGSASKATQPQACKHRAAVLPNEMQQPIHQAALANAGSISESDMATRCCYEAQAEQWLLRGHPSLASTQLLQ